MYGTYLRLEITVHDGWRAVVRAAARKLKPAVRHDRTMRRERHRFYRQMLTHHEDVQRVVHEWRL